MVLVDTSVWSLLFRKNGPAEVPEVEALQRFLRGEEQVAVTGVIAQELFYGLAASKLVDAIAQVFSALHFVTATLDDHIAAARLQRPLREHGVQFGSADALIAQLALAHDLTLLTTDRDFMHAAQHVPLHLWATDA